MVISIQEMRKAEQRRQLEEERQQLQARNSRFGSATLKEPVPQGILKFVRFLYEN